MRLISTKNKNNTINFKDAIFKPMAKAGGLWLFEKINQMDITFLENLKSMTLKEIAFFVFRHFDQEKDCPLYTSPSPRDKRQSRMPSSA